MRTLIPLLALVLLCMFGCSTPGPAVVDYQGPQDWPTGRPSSAGGEIGSTPIVYGLPDQPYEVVQIVDIPRKGDAEDHELLAVSEALLDSRPHALILIGTNGDRVLEVDKFVSGARVDSRCVRVLEEVRANNRDMTAPCLRFLAVRYKPGNQHWHPYGG
jgi:hypothetical protein